MRRDDGFTLLEIIVAVVVMGFVLAGLAQAAKFGITAWSVQARIAEQAATMERVERVLRTVVEQAAPPMSADDKTFTGLEHRMTLITRLPSQPVTDPVRRAQVALGVDEKDRLLLRWRRRRKLCCWMAWTIWICHTGRRWRTAANGCGGGTIRRCRRW